METIKLTRARAHAGVAAMLLGSVAWSGAALAQAVSNPTAGAAAANANAAAATVDANAAAANAAGRGQNSNTGAAASRAPTDPGVTQGPTPDPWKTPVTTGDVDPAPGPCPEDTTPSGSQQGTNTSGTN